MSSKNYNMGVHTSPHNNEQFVILVKDKGNAKTGSATVEIGFFPLGAIPARSTVCFTCKHLEGVCYVDPRGTGSQLRSYTSGRNYQETPPKGYYINRVVRLGNDGDPILLGLAKARRIKKQAALVIGYTHTWLWCEEGWKEILQASVDSEAEYYQAKAMGWGTFRVKNAWEPVLEGEIECPNSLNDEIKCSSCGLCNGSGKHIVIDVHGLDWKVKNFANATVLGEQQ